MSAMHYSNSISQRVMKPLTLDVFTAARELRDGMESSRLSLAERERLLRMCDTAHRLGRWALGAGGIHRTRR